MSHADPCGRRRSLSRARCARPPRAAASSTCSTSARCRTRRVSVDDRGRATRRRRDPQHGRARGAADRRGRRVRPGARARRRCRRRSARRARMRCSTRRGPRRSTCAGRSTAFARGSRRSRVGSARRRGVGRGRRDPRRGHRDQCTRSAARLGVAARHRARTRSAGQRDDALQRRRTRDVRLRDGDGADLPRACRRHCRCTSGSAKRGRGCRART